MKGSVKDWVEELIVGLVRGLESPEVIPCLCDCKVEKGFQEGKRMQRPTNDIGIAREVESRVSKEDACQLHRL